VNDKATSQETSESDESRRFDKLDSEASPLLSEPHAACQATQRSVRDIQERLAAMVLQHSRAQAGQHSSGEKQDASSPSDSPSSADAAQR